MGVAIVWLGVVKWGLGMEEGVAHTSGLGEGFAASVTM